MPRHVARIDAAITTGSGSMRLGFFTAQKSETVTQVKTIVGPTAAVGATLAKIGIFSVANDGTGTLTLVARTADLHTTLWTGAAGTVYTSTFESAASFTKIKGQRYATATLVVGASTYPTLAGWSAYFPAAETGSAAAPRLSGLYSGQTDFGSVGSTISSGSYGDTGVSYAYVALLP